VKLSCGQYDIDGFERAEIKLGFNIAINATNRRAAIAALARRVHRTRSFHFRVFALNRWRSSGIFYTDQVLDEGESRPPDPSPVAKVRDDCLSACRTCAEQTLVGCRSNCGLLACSTKGQYSNHGVRACRRATQGLSISTQFARSAALRCTFPAPSLTSLASFITSTNARNAGALKAL
jgi:hypothetical protein